MLILKLITPEDKHTDSQAALPADSSSVMDMFRSVRTRRNATVLKKNAIVLTICFLMGVVLVRALMQAILDVPSGNQGYLLSKEEKYNAKLPKFTTDIIAKLSKFTTK